MLFSKTGNAVWISHLDTMRLFQRAFKRCGFHLKHTQGFNPRPSVSIALPLSVGIESYCELLDFELEDQAVSCSEVMDRLNRSLIDGIRILEVYEVGTKLKNLKYLQCEITLDYDHGIPLGASDAIRELFQRPELLMDKKSKNGVISQNIVPMIRSITIQCLSECRLSIEAVICCQEPSLNPALLSAAIVKYLPQYAPDFAKCCRRELLDAEQQVFR
jgi:radical SAM-linked protein